jgi:hypothetical protein
MQFQQPVTFDDDLAQDFDGFFAIRPEDRADAVMAVISSL